MNTEEIISSFVILWAVIDPIGTIPVFIAITKNYEEKEKKKIARVASFVAFMVLMFFLFVGESILKNVGVPLSAFQTSGGLILLLFAINMIFGDSKPEEEIQLVKSSNETAIFPLAIPSIAGPGALLAVVLLTSGAKLSITTQLITGALVVLVLIINFVLMMFASRIQKLIGSSGAIIISKIMGLILASMAANNILLGIKEFFKIN